MGRESLILGVVAMLTWLIPLIGIPIPVVGLILGILALRRKAARRWMAGTGVALSATGLALAISYSIISVTEPTTITTVDIADMATDSTLVDKGDSPAIAVPESVDWSADGVISPGEYKNFQQFGENYELHWSIEDEYLLVAMKARTSGWVAFGIQPDLRSEKNIDMILGYVSDKKTTVFDLFIADNPELYARDVELGGTNDITEFGGKEERSFTVVEFKRKVNNNDEYDQPLISGANIIRWAYGSDDSRDAPVSNQGFSVIEL